MTLTPQLYSLLDSAMAEGRIDDVRIWKNTLTDNATDADSLDLLARIYAHDGDPIGGIALLGEAIRRNPKTDSLYAHRATLYRSLGEHSRAAEDFARIIRSGPASREQLLDYAQEAVQANLFTEAAATLKPLTVREPNNALCLNLLGAMLQLVERCADALPYHQRACALDPTNADFANNLGTSLRRLRNFPEAKDQFQRAIKLDPTHYMAWYNLGNVYRSMRQLDAALEAYSESIRHNPNYPESHFGLACSLLQRNDWQRGWVEFEWRWKSAKIVAPITIELPQWEGQPLSGRRLLVVTEQGSGDTLQFVRYTKQLVDLGARVSIWAPKETAALLARLPHIDAAASLRQDLPESDLYAPMMSLPRLLQATPETIPTAPYLHFDPLRAKKFSRKLGPRQERLRLGLVWAGNPQQGDDGFRSTTLQDLAPLFELDDVRWISIQKGPHALSRQPTAFPIEDWSEELDSFDATAALFANLDGLVSVCTGPLHLAGGLGMQTICMLSWSGDWRWGSDASTTNWYPSMDILRQPVQGDWKTVAHNACTRIASWKRTTLVPVMRLTKSQV